MPKHIQVESAIQYLGNTRPKRYKPNQTKKQQIKTKNHRHYGKALLEFWNKIIFVNITH